MFKYKVSYIMPDGTVKDVIIEVQNEEDPYVFESEATSIIYRKGLELGAVDIDWIIPIYDDESENEFAF